MALHKKHFFSVMEGKGEGKFGMGIDVNGAVAFYGVIKRRRF